VHRMLCEDAFSARERESVMVCDVVRVYVCRGVARVCAVWAVSCVVWAVSCVVFMCCV